jgi:hypothetical protein
MKTVIKVIVAIAVVNALARCGDAYWSFYQLKDAAQQAIVFAGRQTSAQIENDIMQKATALDVPLPPENLDVHHTQTHRIASASYTQDVEIFPNYVYPVPFSFTVDAIAPGGLPPDESK